MSGKRREIAIVGGGLAGYSVAIGMAARGFDTVLIAPPAGTDDRRTTALIGQSVAFLSEIGVFERVRAGAEALSVMRLIDDCGRLFRAPVVEFRASEIGLAAFGYNTANVDLLEALRQRATELDSRLEIVARPAIAIETDADGATVETEGGERYRAALLVGADGRRSLARETAGIDLREWSYPQSALVTNFRHALDHGQVSTEFHTRSGPFTQVPLLGRRSSLVWVEEPRLADLYVDLKPERLGRIIEEKMHSILGAVEIDGPIQRFQLSGATASRLTGERIALVGEAGHVFPPIGAQGLNLGLRDAQAIVRLAGERRDDPGSRQTLGRYEAARRGDIASRTVGVDLLNRSLLAGFLPVQMARSAGLSAMTALPFLKRFAMREGLAPGAGIGGIPRSVREGIGGDRP